MNRYIAGAIFLSLTSTLAAAQTPRPTAGQGPWEMMPAMPPNQTDLFPRMFMLNTVTGEVRYCFIVGGMGGPPYGCLTLPSATDAPHTLVH